MPIPPNNCEARYPDIQDATKLVNAGRIHLDPNVLPGCLAAYHNAATTCLIAEVCLCRLPEPLRRHEGCE